MQLDVGEMHTSSRVGRCAHASSFPASSWFTVGQYKALPTQSSHLLLSIENKIIQQVFYNDSFTL